MDAFGDVIMATVLADKLKAAGHNVDFYVSSAVEPILNGHPSLRSIPNDRKTPVNIELDNTYETNQERRTKSVPRLFIEAAAHQLRNIGLQGVSTTNLYPSFPIGSDERQTMLERGKAIPRPWVAMNHRSQSWPSRSVSVESLTEAARQIKGSVIWTHPGPVPKGCHSIRTGSFRELMALLSVCDLLVTPDSGPMHAASAVGCPVIALEQSQPIALRMPPQCDHRVLSAPVDCVRCLEWKCPKDEIRPPCQTFNHAVIAGAVNARLAGTGKVSVVIPVYKNHPRLKRCVNAIPAGTEIVVALDGDAETPVLPVTVVPSPGSRTGFGRTCTRGAREANGEFLLFLNDDCYLNPGAIPAMLKEMRPDVAVVGCLLRYPDGRIQHGGTTRSGDKGGFGHIDHTRTVPSITTPREMEFVTFAAALVRRKAFFQVHGFDEDYDTYCEDSDLCLRLRAKGWKIIYTPHASGVHDESQTTSPMKTELWNKSSVVFWNRWKHLFQP
jgi:GT2 family glycosyltransferase/ADP-heptose:LPS heptosyltransferase